MTWFSKTFLVFSVSWQSACHCPYLEGGTETNKCAVCSGQCSPVSLCLGSECARCQLTQFKAARIAWCSSQQLPLGVPPLFWISAFDLSGVLVVVMMVRVFYMLLLIFIYLKVKQIFHLLGHSSNAGNYQFKPKLKSEAYNSTWVSHMGGGEPRTWAITWRFPGCALTGI